MTELEAQRLLAEHRTINPTKVIGRVRYQIQTATGRVQAFDAVGKSGQRWAMRSNWTALDSAEVRYTDGLAAWLRSHGLAVQP